MGKTFSTGLLTNGIWQDASNNIGIGGSPSGSYKLDVTGTGRFTSNVILNNLGIGGQTIRSSSALKVIESNNWVIEDNGDFGFKSNAYFNGTNNVYINTGLATRLYAGNGAFEFYTAPSGTAGATTTFTSRFFIGNTGNVGIGTSSPADILDVQKNQNATTNFYFRNTNTTDSNSRAYLNVISGNVTTSLQAINNDHSYLNCTNNLYFQIGSNTIFYNGGSERMRITSGGSVSIATSTDLSNSIKLNVNGRASFNMSADPGGETINLTTWISGSAAYGIFVQGDAGAYTQRAMRFFHSGSGAAVVGNISFTTTNTTYTTTSDYRLKEDLQDFNGIDLVSKIKTYDFKWKSEDKRMYGVIAHELESIIDYAVVGQKDAEEMQSVDYSLLTPILVKAIQELNAKVSALENK